VAQVAAPQTATPTVAKLSLALQRRYGAMHFALSKRGGWYVWGGNGPKNYDCSGLVVAAYNHVHISLPRTTQSMLRSGKLIRVSQKNARWGDIVFWGDYHVEMVSSPYRYSFGAHHTGVRIGYRHYYGHPTFYKVRGT
jgi:cell wall-associated NlpC family hydrolase